LARDVVPFFKEARVPARWIIVVTIIASVLAAQGTDAIVRRRVDRRVLAAVGVLAFVIATAVAIGGFDLPAGKAIAAWAVIAGLVVVGIGIVALAPRPWALVGVGILVATVTVELGLMARHGPPRLLAAPASVTSTSSRPIRYLEHHPGRTIAMTEERFDDTAYMIRGLRPNANSLFDIRSIDGYDGGP